MDVGLELRQARERRGMSLQQISNNTKISLRVLQAIEASDEARLPARVFTRSFVRSYATEVGLDPESTMRRYVEQIEPPQAPPTASIDQAAPEPPRAAPQDAHTAASKGRILRGRFGTAAVILLTGTTGILLAGREARHEQSGETPRPLSRSVNAAAPIPAGTAPAPVGTSGAAAESPNVLHLAIAPTGPCWVQAKVGGESVFGTLLAAGDRKTVDTPSDVTLRVGDPATFAFSINGKPARVPGTAGQAVTVRVTKENFRQFLTH